MNIFSEVVRTRHLALSMHSWGFVECNKNVSTLVTYVLNKEGSVRNMFFLHEISGSAFHMIFKSGTR